ncbi:YdeI/OmpD-associated family protein [Hymenobacter persicinus]|uniref:YdhG-like domain-containing protein n=1 Tax=Hymenobacter persicinus TaxID=2025506 RepID=A0A4Q5LAK7_9BACT|nr:DUF1801 domain-containing protein [Hymenobacter persicinus]RYU75316.1 hypothetical protein EWM57_20085 [Hymenobacter persicinus]
MNPNVDWYFPKAKKWQPELEALRAIVLSCGLNEELKWGVPCYTWQQSGVVLLHYFKDYCAVMFLKGALLADANEILVQQTEHTQATRQIRFTSLREVTELEPVLKTYLYEAIEVEKLGLQVKFKATADFTVAEELHSKFAALPALKTAFDALTPGRQRGYLLYFSAPKQAKTRTARVEKCLPLILAGKGLHD